MAAAGCSSIVDMWEPSPQAAVARPTAAAIKTAAEAVAQQEKLEKPIEISQLRASPVSAPEPWMICLRSAKDAAARRRPYAVFFNGDVPKSFGISAVLYDCEGETYSAVQ